MEQISCSLHRSCKTTLLRARALLVAPIMLRVASGETKTGEVVLWRVGNES